jgi:hypothetical protein
MDFDLIWFVRQLADLEDVQVKAVGFGTGGRDRGEVSYRHIRVGSSFPTNVRARTGRENIPFQTFPIR